MEHEMMEHSEILLYSDENGKEFVNVVFMDETFWLTQVGMAELFDSSKSNISEHLSHIFEEEELDKVSCMRKFGISEFSTKPTNFYNLDAIIAVGYRVNSKKATRFRQWATKTLKEYIQKGFVLNDDLMKTAVRSVRTTLTSCSSASGRSVPASAGPIRKSRMSSSSAAMITTKQRHHESVLRICPEQTALRRHRQDGCGTDFRAGNAGQPHDGSYHMEGRAGWKDSQKRHAGGEELPERKRIEPFESSCDHVYRLRRADGRGRAADEYAGLAERNRSIPDQQPPKRAGRQGSHLAGSGSEKGRCDLRGVSQKQDEAYISEFDRQTEKYLKGE